MKVFASIWSFKFVSVQYFTKDLVYQLVISFLSAQDGFTSDSREGYRVFSEGALWYRNKFQEGLHKDSQANNDYFYRIFLKHEK